MKLWNFKFAVAGLLMALCCSPARAEIFELDFETDPAELGVEFFGTSEWREDDGFDDTGYLSVTDALNGQRGSIVFPDLAGGESLRAFSIQADLRVGGGTDRPADGFSFNFARPGDPVLDDGEGWASSPTNEGNLPEEGTTTGVAVGFDEWFSGGADVVGMSIRLDNDLVNQYEFPLLNGEVDDQDSLQTGPQGVFDDELQDLMGWAPLSIEFCNNNLNVNYKGVEVFDEVIEYDPSPGLLVFGGRTGGANAYHHIDNVVVRTSDDVGEGCNVTPPSYIGGEDTIGTRTYDSVRSNEMYGPEAVISGHSGRIVADTGLTIDSMTIAEEILEDEEGVSASYELVDMAGSPGSFPVDAAYPNGVNDSGQDNFAVETVAEVTIPAGTWTIGFGSDDGGALTIPGVEFSVTSDTNDSFDDDQIRFEGTRGHGWTVGSFTLDEPLETVVIGQFFEAGGDDSFEIAVIEDEVIEDASPDTGWELLGDETLGWTVKTVGAPLVSADLTATVASERPLEFDVDGDSGMADQLVVENPDTDVYTTIMELDEGVIFQIKGVGGLSQGQTFDIIDADQVVGTPTITSLDPSQTWEFDAANGLLCFGSCAGGVTGDYNGNGLLDTGDLDLQAAEGIAGGDLAYDLNADGVVNTADRVVWVNDLKNTWMGDADLNGQFDSGDLVTVFAAAKYETGQAATWSQGDWNGDQVFDSGDLVEAFSNAGYEAGERPGGPNPATAVVPEPSSLVLALLSIFGLVGVARRRNG